MQIRESGENYLETILILKQEKGAVRSIDVAQRLGFSKPSISRAVSLLREHGYVLMDGEGWLELTELGLSVAHQMLERHTLLTDFLVLLGVEVPIAAQDACKIEHVISEQSFACIKAFTQAEHARLEKKGF